MQCFRLEETNQEVLPPGCNAIRRYLFINYLPLFVFRCMALMCDREETCDLTLGMYHAFRIFCFRFCDCLDWHQSNRFKSCKGLTCFWALSGVSEGSTSFCLSCLQQHPAHKSASFKTIFYDTEALTLNRLVTRWEILSG